MKTLTTPLALGTANRWRVLSVDIRDSDDLLVVYVQLISNATNLVSETRVRIRNGQSDLVQMDLSQQIIGAALRVTPEIVATPAGYVDALAAWRAGNTSAARREALETWMLTSGVAHTTLAGT